MQTPCVHAILISLWRIPQVLSIDLVFWSYGRVRKSATSMVTHWNIILPSWDFRSNPWSRSLDRTACYWHTSLFRRECSPQCTALCTPHATVTLSCALLQPAGSDQVHYSPVIHGPSVPTTETPGMHGTVILIRLYPGGQSIRALVEWLSQVV